MSSELLAASLLGATCAILSVVVVSRRWAFIGEGIAHAGLGGAGTAWALFLLFPALESQPWLPYAAVVLFCLLTALGIGYLSRGQRVNIDTAIGIFLVASLAWGILAQQLYVQQTHKSPSGWENLFFGQFRNLGLQYLRAVVMICTGVILSLVLLRKEILSYCLDPLLAEVSGVPVRWIHYLLMILLAAVVILGTPIIGSVLVTAMLILPAATAMLLTSRLWSVLLLAVMVSLVAVLTGLLLRYNWDLPAGPVVVLAAFAEFCLAYLGAILVQHWLCKTRG